MRKFTANIHGLQGLAHVTMHIVIQREAKTPKGFTFAIIKKQSKYDGFPKFPMNFN